MHKKLLASAAIAAAAFMLTAPAQASIVANGGFETGDFTGWTQTGNTTFNGVQCPGPGATVQGGNCSAFFGPIGSTGGIQQTLSTIAGETYDIDFYFLADGGITSSFQVTFDGNILTSLSNPAAGGYTLFSYSAIASTNSTLLSFSFRDDPGFLFLDSVSVNQAPEPGTWAMMLLGFGAVGFVIRRGRRGKEALA